MKNYYELDATNIYIFLGKPKVFASHAYFLLFITIVTVNELNTSIQTRECLYTFMNYCLVAGSFALFLSSVNI